MKIGKIVGFFLLGLLIYYLFFYSSVKKYDTAIIEEAGNGRYKVTLVGRRRLMTHDPISALQGKTYMDVFMALLPRKQGVIKGEEFPVQKGYYKILGTINIVKDKMTVDLYYDDTTLKIKKPLFWNGEYKINWVDRNNYIGNFNR
jgi:hypothetical protein